MPFTLALLEAILILLFLPFTVVAENSSTASGASVLNVARITPAGDDVPPGREIVIQFDRPVVPLGRMERSAEEIPISITPELQCQWRWINRATLTCQLGEKTSLLPATQYTLTIRPELNTVEGQSLSETVTHTFITQRPKLEYVSFREWRSPGFPEIKVNFDQPVLKKSLEQALSLRFNQILTTGIEVEEIEQLKGRGWLVRPVEELPFDTPVTLAIAPGVLSRQGTLAGIEDRIAVSFHTFPAFSFVGVRCVTNSGRAITVRPSDPLTAENSCNPMNSIQLVFSAPPTKASVQANLVVKPGFGDKLKDFDPWANVYWHSSRWGSHKQGQEYYLSLPYGLKAFVTYELFAAADKIQDEFERTLATDLKMQFATDHRPPEFHFGHQVSVLEQKVDTHVPIIVNNLSAVTLDYDTLTVNGKAAGTKTFQTYDVEDVAYPLPLKMRELIPAPAGVITGRLSTNPSVTHGPKWFFAEVTPYHVHLKLGHFNSLAWVTRFDSGLPVKGAKASIFVDAYATLKDDPEILAHSFTDKNGLARLPGLTALDPKLRYVNQWRREEPRLMLKVEQDENLALLPVAYDFRAHSYGTYTHTKPRYGHMRAWGTTAQGVYRAGEEVQYKLYVRHQNNYRFTRAPRNGYTLEVMDPMGKKAAEVKNLKLSKFGAYQGSFRTNKNSAVGWYRFVLKANFTKEQWEPLRVLISDFTPAPFKVAADLNGLKFKTGDEVKIASSARLHAGGPYVDAAVRVTAMLQPSSFSPKNPALKDFSFGWPDTWESKQVFQEEGVLNNKGDFNSSFKIADVGIFYGTLEVESSVRDDRGKYVAGRTSAPYFGRTRFVGISQGDWVLHAGKQHELKAVVVDEQGQPVPDVNIKVTFQRWETTAVRVKGAGNAYLTRYDTSWQDVDECVVTSTTKPALCYFSPEKAGSYRFTAKIGEPDSDAGGSAIHKSTISRWAIGKGELLWPTDPSNALKITPDKSEYKIGDTAKFLVHNPYRDSKALVSIERYGIQRSWLTTLKSNTEIIEVKITPDHLPGLYFSVVVVSPRVAQPLGENEVDLGKPAFKIGYVRVPVKDPYKELVVEVSPEQEKYRPRDLAKINLKVSTRQNDKPAMELAVAVLDQSVFDLLAAGKSYFDPYQGFYRLDALDVRNFNILKQLVGRQKFEKKGANAGGGGGADLDLRSLFKFVAYWNPSIIPDKDGRASVSFKLPDNLTAWRVLAMAVTKSDRMGLGDGAFKVNLPTEIRPALPNQVLEGDSFEARFTVMNRTETARTLNVRAHAEGVGVGVIESAKALQTSIEAEPFKRYTVRYPVKTLAVGKVRLHVEAGDDLDRDVTQVELEVKKKVSLEAVAEYGSKTAGKVEIPLLFPEDMRTDVGRVSVVSAPTVIGGLEGAFKYMREYPYLCWEQILSKGVMASMYLNLKLYLDPKFSWKGAKGVSDTTLTLAASFQAPNGGMTYYQPRDQYVSPYLSAYTALAFNWLRELDYKIPEQVEKKLHEYLLTLLRRNVMPDFYSKGMASTVRAVALAALAKHKKVTRADLLRYKPHIPQMSLFGKAHFLTALSLLQSEAKEKNALRDLILSHAHESSGKIVFNENIDSGFARILASPLRTNCAVLSALLQNLKKPQHDDILGDLPFKLVRAITQSRKRRDHWENTQENMFCMNALTEFSRIYEKEAPALRFDIALDQNKLGSWHFENFRQEPIEFDRNLAEDDPGRAANLSIDIQGAGRLYYAARMFYSPRNPGLKALNSGIEVRREYSVERDGKWELLEGPLKIKQGELVRVDLFVSLPTARNFVVVDDPVPGGLEPINRDLATASAVDADKAKYKFAEGSFWFERDDWLHYGYSHWSFYHKELRHDSARFYSEYLPAGNYHLSYAAQAIAPGEFTALPLNAEEMYDPDIFG
ncbi:MG2 domain-containing protein, partial [Oligoflexia bacterium]|nr:MG2 domain-containing protein [Oligoflexia bacterium]